MPEFNSMWETTKKIGDMFLNKGYSSDKIEEVFLETYLSLRDNQRETEKIMQET
jgi:hypothetical protein